MPVLLQSYHRISNCGAGTSRKDTFPPTFLSRVPSEPVSVWHICELLQLKYGNITQRHAGRKLQRHRHEGTRTRRRKYDRHFIKWLSGGSSCPAEGGPRPRFHCAPHPLELMCMFCERRGSELELKVLRSFSKASLRVIQVVKNSSESKPKQ